MEKDTPARKALEEYLKPLKRPPGRPKLTWMSVIYTNLKTYSGLEGEVDFTNAQTMIQDLGMLCNDRKRWRTFVRNIKLQ